MKKHLLLLGISALSVSMLTLNSCDKVKDAIFQAFTANGGSIDFNIPIITNITDNHEVGSASTNLNIDSLIKAETKNQFSLNDIKTVRLEEAVVKINNADATNNFANFESGELKFHTNNNPTVVSVATGPNPDVYSESLTLPPISGVNLKDYMTGNTLFYELHAKMRRVTTKELNCTLTVKFKIEN